MKHILIIVSMLLSIIVTPACAENTQEIYQLYPGDNLMISIWREDNMQRQVTVLPDGSITFPLIGRVEVANMSTTEVEKRITSRLKEFYPDPIVSVVIMGIDGHRAYVTGKVIHPGPIIVNGPITVLQAISIAGGFDRFADEGGIKVIRSLPQGQEVLRVNYKEIISGKDMTTNFQLKVGDTVIVP